MEITGTWIWDKFEKNWAVLAQIDAARTGSVNVLKKDGTTEVVAVHAPKARAKTFVSRFGPLQGESVTYVTPLPKEEKAPGTAPRRRTPIYAPAGGALTPRQKREILWAWDAQNVAFKSTFDKADLALFGLQDFIAGRSDDGAVAVVVDGQEKVLAKSDLPWLAAHCAAANSAAEQF